MLIRRADSRDLPQLSQLYRDSVEAIGPTAYSPQQVTAWSAFAQADNFALFIATATTFVAEDASGIVGFCGIEADGHVASIYVRPDSMRLGIGSRLLSHVLLHANDLGLRRLHVEASHFSRPLFLRHGFVDSGTEVVERNGVSFERFLMERIAPDRH